METVYAVGWTLLGILLLWLLVIEPVMYFLSLL